MDPEVVVLPTSGTLAMSEETRERPSFELVYGRHFRGIWRTLRRLGVAAAHLDDAAQDVFVVAHRRLGEFDGRSLRGWLYGIALRVASDYRRGAARRESLPLEESFPTPAPDPAQASELSESVRVLHLLLGELAEPKRTVFVLGELEELSAPEIAEVLGVNLNTVYSRLRAARGDFDAALKRHRARSDRRAR